MTPSAIALKVPVAVSLVVLVVVGLLLVFGPPLKVDKTSSPFAIPPRTPATST